MDCKHDRVRCTDNRFFCLVCGEELPQMGRVVRMKELPELETPEEKKPRTRKKKEVAE